MKKISLNQLLKLKEKESYFKITVVNSMNYQIKQLSVDNKNKTYEIGCFSWNENIVTHKTFNDFIDLLNNMNYKQIKRGENK